MILSKSYIKQHLKNSVMFSIILPIIGGETVEYPFDAEYKNAKLYISNNYYNDPTKFMKKHYEKLLKEIINLDVECLTSHGQKLSRVHFALEMLK